VRGTFLEAARNETEAREKASEYAATLRALRAAGTFTVAAVFSAGAGWHVELFEEGDE
jgi:hypothetical protein